ncbi:class I SAM-dependent DNA methyltransferase [Pandoraea norimbergensis]|nr:class I SAM-dependent DNA methyltransferase [Pandoraea norimbergensis]
MWKDPGIDGDAQRLSQLCWMFFLKIIDDQEQQLKNENSHYRSTIPTKFRWKNWAKSESLNDESDLISFVNGELFPALKSLPRNKKQARVVNAVFEDAFNYMKSGKLMRQVIKKINEVDFNDIAERKHFGDIYEQLLNDLQAAGHAGEFYTPRAITAFMVGRINPQLGETILDPSCGTGGFLTCSIRHMRRFVKTPDDERTLQAGLRAVELKQLPHMLCVTNMLLHGVEDPGFVIHGNALARPYESYTRRDEVDVILSNPPFGGQIEEGIEQNFPIEFRTKESADLFLALYMRLLKPGGRAAVVLPDGLLFGDGIKRRLKKALLEQCDLHTIVRLPDSVFKPYASVGTNLLFFDKGKPTREIWFYELRIPDGQKAYSMSKPIKEDHLNDCVRWWGGPDRRNRAESDVAWRIGLAEIETRNYNIAIRNPYNSVDKLDEPADLLARLEEGEKITTELRDRLKHALMQILLQ